jgi:hypothetical protein
MKVILDFDGVGDPKFKKVILSLIDKVVEYIPQFHKLIDEFIWLWPHLTNQSDWEKEKSENLKSLQKK